MRELSKSPCSDILQILYGFIIEWKFSPLAVYLHFIKHIGRNPEIERVNILFTNPLLKMVIGACGFSEVVTFSTVCND